MSTTFLDGPAVDARLELQRAPYFLRVVISPNGKCDALDLIDEEPMDNEVIHVYRLSINLGTGIACTRGKGCRRFSSAIYKLHEVQPSDAQARDTSLWHEWCEGQADKLSKAEGSDHGAKRV